MVNSDVGTRMVLPQVRIGTDLMMVADVADSIARFGDCYLQRVFTARELETCAMSDGMPDASRLAARFAAREATIKALGVTLSMSLTDIEVVSSATGQPSLCLRGAVAAAADQVGAYSIEVSLSHEGPFAAATVVVLTAPSIAIETGVTS